MSIGTSPTAFKEYAMTKFAYAALTCAVALTTAPTFASANNRLSFEHDGVRYTYTIISSGEQKIVRGIEERTGESFVLRVSKNRVEGSIGGKSVSFPRSAVKPLLVVTQTVALR
jgi:hypothetical protein